MSLLRPELSRLHTRTLKRPAPAPLGLLTLVILVAVAAIWSGRGSVDAHAVQVSSDPEPNAQLAEAPAFVTVNFSEPIEAAVTTVQLWDTSPAELPLAAPEFPDAQSVRIALPPDLEPGIYTVIWRNLSTVDAHTWSGSFPFTILGPGGEVPAGEVPPELAALAAAPSDNPTLIDSMAGWALLLGVAVTLGGVAYVLFVANPAASALSGENATKLHDLSRAILLVVSAIGVFLVLQGSLIQLMVAADRLGALGRVDEILTGTRSGHYLIARQALLAVALGAIGLAWAARSFRLQTIAFGALLVVSFGILLTKSLVSHPAAASEGSFWTSTTDILHLLAASLWIGGLIHVGLAMPRWLDTLQGVPRTLFAADSFRRFSVLAAFSIVLLIASGAISALVQFTSWPELWETTYGRSLLGKFGVMVPLLGVAALNAFVFAPRVERVSTELRGAAIDAGERGSETAERLQRMLANTVRVEAVLGVATLIAVAVLIQLQPPRAIAEATAAPDEPASQTNEEGFFQDAVQTGGLVVSLRIAPGQVGSNTFELGLGSEFGGIGQVDLVRLDFQHTDAALAGQSSLELALVGSAKFEAEGANLSIPGEYDVTATIRRRGEDDDVQAFFTVPIGEAKTAEAHESSIWGWPFAGARSAGAIAVLIAGAAGLLVAGGVQLGRMRRQG